MKKIAAILVLSCTFCFSGCEMVTDLFAPRFDATSTESFTDSYIKIKDSLSEDEVNKLNEALLYQSAIYLKEHPGDALFALGAAVVTEDHNNTITQGFSKDLMKTFDGKTAKQVIREYETARKNSN